MQHRVKKRTLVELPLAEQVKLEADMSTYPARWPSLFGRDQSWVHLCVFDPSTQTGA